MATKRNGKSNKTAHVLSVLSGAQQEDTGEGVLLTENPSVSLEENQPAPRRARTPRPPALEQAGAGDDALAEAIRDSLSEQLGFSAEEPPVEPLSVEEPLVEPPSVEEPAMEAPPVEAPPVEASPVEAPPGAGPSVEVPLMEETPAAEAPAAEPPVNTPPAEKPPVIRPDIPGVIQVQTPGEAQGELSYVNVMQALVEERTPRYIKMFGVCDCPRCVADVKALALSSLPPKYAVMRAGEVIPMLTVYEGRYSTALTAQILSACNKVMDRPRH